MGNEVLRRDEIKPGEYVYETYTKTIKADDPQLKIPFDKVINRVLNFVNVSDIIQNIQKDSEYVVQIPVEFKKQYESGEFWIMKNLKNGKEWPTLMKKGSNGKNEIVTPLAIKKKSFVQGNPIQDLTQQFQMMQIQSQIQKQNEILEDICETVKHIEQGQMNDRIALLEAGKDQIIYALERDDSDPGKRTAIENGISDMIQAQNQIFKEFEYQVLNFKPIPESKPQRILEEFIHSDYLNKQSNNYNKIVDYYELYKEATKYIAFAHVLIGQEKSISKIYSNSIGKMQSLNYGNLRTIEYIHPKENYQFLYDEDIKQLEEDRKNCVLISRKYDSLSIEFTGEQLLEITQYEE